MSAGVEYQNIAHQDSYAGAYTSGYGGGYADTTLGNGSYVGAPAIGGSYIGSQVGPAGPPSVAVQEQQGYQEFVVRVPAPEVSQYIQGPPQYRTQVIPGRVMERVIPEYVQGPTQTVQEVVPGPITYRDEKVEVPGPVRERIERVEVPGPVYEHIEKEFIPGPEIVKEVEVQVPGPVVEKIVKVDVAGPVIRRSVPGKQVEIPGPIRYVNKPVPVPRDVIREVYVNKPVIQAVPVTMLVPGPRRALYFKARSNEAVELNNKLRAEYAQLVQTRERPSSEFKYVQSVVRQTNNTHIAPWTAPVAAAPVVVPQAPLFGGVDQFAGFGAPVQQFAAAPVQQYGAAQYGAAPVQGYGTVPAGYYGAGF